MKPITLFSWGYYGWGNATKHLLKAVDAIEESRGFKPPIFVDIRISRAVRATGFNGTAFEKLLGKRYVWMRSLGNKRIKSGTGKRIQIAEPEAVNELLDLAQEKAKHKQRVIFFCHCLFPKGNDQGDCHRSVVSELLLSTALKRKIAIRVVEWPGDVRPKQVMKLKEEPFQAVRNYASYIPVPHSCRPEILKGPPWGTIITFKCGKETLHRLAGPLIWRGQQWKLPVLDLPDYPEASMAEYVTLAKEDVAYFGLDGCFSK